MLHSVIFGKQLFEGLSGKPSISMNRVGTSTAEFSVWIQIRAAIWTLCQVLFFTATSGAEPTVGGVSKPAVGARPS